MKKPHQIDEAISTENSISFSSQNKGKSFSSKSEISIFELINLVLFPIF